MKISTDLSGRELVTALQRIGFVVARQRGSHIILRRESPKARVVVPDHSSFVLGLFARSSTKRGYRWTGSSSYFSDSSYTSLSDPL